MSKRTFVQLLGSLPAQTLDARAGDHCLTFYSKPQAKKAGMPLPPKDVMARVDREQSPVHPNSKSQSEDWLDVVLNVPVLTRSVVEATLKEIFIGPVVVL